LPTADPALNDLSCRLSIGELELCFDVGHVPSEERIMHGLRPAPLHRLPVRQTQLADDGSLDEGVLARRRALGNRFAKRLEQFFREIEGDLLRMRGPHHETCLPVKSTR